jgi:hypothetical protein
MTFGLGTEFIITAQWIGTIFLWKIFAKYSLHLDKVCLRHLPIVVTLDWCITVITSRVIKNEVLVIRWDEFTEHTAWISSHGMICIPAFMTIFKIRGFHGSESEECRLLGYKNPVCTSQEGHYLLATELSRLMLFKVWSFHGGHYEECRLLASDAVWLLKEPTFRGKLASPSSGWQESVN